MTRLILMLVLSCGIVAGCSSEPKGEKWAKSHSELNDRLRAAQAIGDNAKRDEALVNIATDATRKNDASVALEATQLIGMNTKRDQIAKLAAITFHGRKDRATANRFVEMIGSNATRDELNERFAR